MWRSGLKKPQVSAEQKKVKLCRAFVHPEKTAQHSLSQGSSPACHFARHLNVQLENRPLCLHQAEILEKHQPEQLSCFQE